MAPIIKIKRAYESPYKEDGCRVLVDRLWPRGLETEAAAFDEWAKDLAPSVYLRKWFGHDPDLWIEFQKKYWDELKRRKAVDSFVERHEGEEIITLIYSAKDTEHNHAIVLQQFLEQKYKS